MEYKSFEDRLKTFETWTSEIPSHRMARAGFEYTGEADIVICQSCKVEIYKWEPNDDPIEDHRELNPNCYFFKSNLHERLNSFNVWPISMHQKPEEMAEAGFFYTGCGDRVQCFSCRVELKSWHPEDIPFEQHAVWASKCVYLNSMKDSSYILDSKERLLKQHVEVKDINKSESKSTTTSTASFQISSKICCKVCYVQDSSIVFLPCKHLCCCDECALKFDKCILCRQAIASYMKIFIP